MDVTVDQAAAMLGRMPAVLRGLLGGIGSEWAHGDYGPGTFSPFDVVGHLISGERSNWLPRIRQIVEEGASRPFTVFDRYEHFEQSRGKGMDQLLDEFSACREQSLIGLRGLNLREADLHRRGLHPVLGEVSLGQLLATWVVHDLNHLAQITRGLAARYEEAVGPWRGYLGIYRGPVTPMDAQGQERRRAARGEPA